MAGFKRKRFSRGRRTFKRRGFRRPRSTFRLAKRAYKGVRRIQAGIETKQITTAYGLSSISAGGTTARYLVYNPQDQIVQGVTRGQRVGDVIVNKSIEIQFMLQMNGSYTDSWMIAHFLLVWVPAWNGRLVTSFDPEDAQGLYDTSPGTTGYYPNMTRRWQTRKDYRVIKHWSRQMNLNTLSVPVYSNVWSFHKHIRMKNRKTIYKASTGVSSDIQHGALIFLWWWAGTSNATTNPPSVAATVRTKFQDP